MTQALGRSIVRGLARVLLLLYPRPFRHAHAQAFRDVAAHIWTRHASTNSAARATLLTARLLLADSIEGTRMTWFAARDEYNANVPWAQRVAGRTAQWLGGGWDDLGLALRAIKHRRGPSLLVVLTLGLGIGTGAAAFDALDRAVLRPLPFAGADQLMLLALKDVQRGYWTTPSQNAFEKWRSQAHTLEAIEIFSGTTVVWQATEGAERHEGLTVSGGLLGMLRVKPVAGRLLQPSDATPDAPATAMIAEQLWRRRFGADPSIVGRTLPLGAPARPTTIVGVLPAGARIDPTIVPDFLVVLPKGRELRPGSLMWILARAAPGVSAEDVERDLATITPPETNASGRRVPDVATPVELFLGDAFGRAVWLVFAGALGLLVVALMNAGHLLLARAAARTHEIGVRLALGGSTARLLRLFLAESVLYVGAGVGIAIVIMAGVESLITRYDARLFMTMSQAGLEGRAFWFIAAIAAVATIVCVAAPLLRARSTEIRLVLERAGSARATGRRSRAFAVLVGIQATLAVLLACGSAVMVRSVRNLLAVDSGIAIDHLAAISVSAPAAIYPTAEAQTAYINRVEDALKATPSLVGVTTSGTPLLNVSQQTGLPYLDGEAKPVAGATSTGLASVPLNYFEVTGMRLVAGRLFRPEDGPDVAIVNAAFAASRGGQVIGRKVYTPAGKTPAEIIGVVNDVKAFGLADRTERFSLYFPDLRTTRDPFTRFIIRTSGDPALVLSDTQRRIAAIDRTVPVFTPETGPQVIARHTLPHRFVAVLLVGLALMGVVLALAGVYGSAALEVARRTREIGIRLALGATAARVVSRIVSAGLRPVLVGGVVGVGLAWLALPYVEVLLFRVSAADPVSAAVGLGLVVVAGTCAAWIPARLVSRIDPALTLRQ